MSLVIWIAVFKILIHFLYIYVDNSFSFKDKCSLELYTSYKKLLPSNIVKLLCLWDAIGLLHEEKKQIFGLELPIIGCVDLVYWFPSLNTRFQLPLSGSAPSGTIFYFEALSITAALLESVVHLSIGQQIAIFTDKLNSVSMFKSLAALLPYNWLLMASVDAIIAAQLNFWVFFIPGVNNVVADHLSHWKNAEAQLALLELAIHPFIPPWNALGVGKK
ncbi:uncharacterized protein EDB93DRAFT_1252064 [Suillus bovinus]|uniref:uncharacterized protein n=1 Tax=Suillus bovinus TaxID=48563 RepID=UPI001B869F97|nr:uncharacterized protein EDB93DRAFT_1252064 [Suillus bovinus]KAG2143460.1 hypothetical protein EDB93DRAFT_1252064 [Suillus bovinus]